MAAALTRRRFQPVRHGRRQGPEAVINARACLAGLGLACAICAGSCAEDAINFSADRLIPDIDQGRCAGCGECVPACPSRAISLRI